MQPIDQERHLSPMVKDQRNIDGGDDKRKRPAKNSMSMNPLQAAIQGFIISRLPSGTIHDHGLDPNNLAPFLPKRFTIYEPLLLLPTNAFNTSPAWHRLYTSLDGNERHALYEFIVNSFAKKGVTHLAINSPILQMDTQGNEN